MNTIRIDSPDHAAFVQAGGIQLVKVEPIGQFLIFHYPGDRAGEIKTLIKKFKWNEPVPAKTLIEELRKVRQAIARHRRGEVVR